MSDFSNSETSFGGYGFLNFSMLKSNFLAKKYCIFFVTIVGYFCLLFYFFVSHIIMGLKFTKFKYKMAITLDKKIRRQPLRVPIEKTDLVRLKLYLYTLLWAFKIFGVKTLMGVERFEVHFLAIFLVDYKVLISCPKNHERFTWRHLSENFC